MLARGATISLFGSLTGLAVGFASHLALGRILGPANFGLYSLGLAMTRIGIQVASLGLTTAVIYYGGQYWRTDAAKFRDVILQSAGVTLSVGILMAGVLVIAAPYLANALFKEPQLTAVIRGLSPAIALFAASQVAAATIAVSRRIRYAVYVDQVSVISFLVLFVALWLLGWKLAGAVAAFVGSAGIALLAAGYCLRLVFPEALSARGAQTIVIRDLLAFAMPAFLAGAFGAPRQWTAQLFLGYFFSASEVGIFQAAFQTSTLLTASLFAVSAIFEVMTADLYARHETSRLQELFKVSTKWVLYWSLIAFLIMASAPREFMVVLFGLRYRRGGLALLMLSIGRFINAGTGPVGSVLLLTGRQKRLLQISAIALIAHLVLCLLFIPAFGVPGAALASALSTGGMSVAQVIVVRRELIMWPYDRRCLKGLAAAVVAAAALLPLSRFHIEPMTFALLVKAVVCTVTFGAALLLIGLDEEDRQVLSLLVRQRR